VTPKKIHFGESRDGHINLVYLVFFRWNWMHCQKAINHTLIYIYCVEINYECVEAQESREIMVIIINDQKKTQKSGKQRKLNKFRLVVDTKKAHEKEIFERKEVTWYKSEYLHCCRSWIAGDFMVICLIQLKWKFMDMRKPLLFIVMFRQQQTQEIDVCE
jgi:hypothetical protein